MADASPAPVNSDLAAKIPTTIQDLRSRFLSAILIVASIIGSFVVVTDITSASTPSIGAILAGYTLILVATFTPIPFIYKTGIVLSVAYLLGIYNLLGTGIFGYAPLFFLAFCVLASMFINWKAYIVSLVLSLAAIAFFGWYFITGRMYLSSSEVPVGSDTYWIWISLVLVGVSLLCEEGWRRLSKEFLVSQLTLKNAMNTLANERMNLEKRIADRTRDLSLNADAANTRAERLRAVTEIMAGVTSIQEIDQLLTVICRLVGESFNLYHVGIYLNENRNNYSELQAAYGINAERLLFQSRKYKLGQSGIIGMVAQSGEPHVTETTKDDLAYDADPELPETRSLMALPLIVNKVVIGVLHLESSKEQGLAAKDLELMTTLANQVAVAIENARISTETRRALSEARVVYGQYVRQAWEQYSEEKQKMGYLFDSSKITPVEEPFEFPEIVSAMESGQPVTLNKGNPAVSIPLKIRDQVIGVLDVRSKDSNRQWNEHELGVIQAVAERVALALENARLFEETTRRADRERAVSEITNRIRSTNDPQMMLQTALNELKRALGAQEVRIRPYSPAALEEKRR